MALVLIVLLVIVALGLGGFALEVLWWIAIALLVIWLAGWLFGAADQGGRRRWYGRW